LNSTFDKYKIRAKSPQIPKNKIKTDFDPLDAEVRPVGEILTIDYFLKLCKEAKEYNDQFVYAYQPDPHD